MKKHILITMLIFVIIFGSMLCWYFTTTLSAKDCIQYCMENTQRGATAFEPIGDPRYTESYVYWVAANGDTSKPQEIFIFKQKFFGPFAFFNRYQYVASSVQSNLPTRNSGVGSIQFFTYNNDNEKENESTLLFYGARNDIDAFWYECTVSFSKNVETFTGKVLLRNNIWMLRSFDLGDANENEERKILKLNLYDEDKNLLYCY